MPPGGGLSRPDEACEDDRGNVFSGAHFGVRMVANGEVTTYFVVKLFSKFQQRWCCGCVVPVSVVVLFVPRWTNETRMICGFTHLWVVCRHGWTQTSSSEHLGWLVL